MIDATDNEVHSETPPCDCQACQQATVAADQQRTELDAIFSRVAEAERLSKEAE